MSDSNADGLAEQVDAVDLDPGGVPFDDDFPEDVPDDLGGRGPGEAYDSPKVLQQRGIGYPDKAPVGMTVLRGYVMPRWGGSDLGILARPPRPVRGGSSPSLHNWGMAWDWRWANPGPGRATADEVIKFCLDNAAPLGIQAVHDYAAGRYWKSYAGWKNATTSASTGFGQPWAQWLHIERTYAAANLGDGIESLLSGGGAPVPKVADPVDQPLPEGPLKVGSAGADVARLQDFLRLFAFADFTRSDGVFGPRTDAGVRKAQTDFKGRGWYESDIDGIWGPKSCAAGKQLLAQGKA
jgi:hypothetical protein